MRVDALERKAKERIENEARVWARGKIRFILRKRGVPDPTREQISEVASIVYWSMIYDDNLKRRSR